MEFPRRFEEQISQRSAQESGGISARVSQLFPKYTFCPIQTKFMCLPSRHFSRKRRFSRMELCSARSCFCVQRVNECQSSVNRSFVGSLSAFSRKFRRGCRRKTVYSGNLFAKTPAIVKSITFQRWAER